MPHGHGVPPIATAATKAFTLVTGPNVEVPASLPLLSARFQRLGADLLISTEEVQLLLGDFFARGRPPDLVQADGVRLAGRLVAALAEAQRPPVDWAAERAGFAIDPEDLSEASGFGGATDVQTADRAQPDPLPDLASEDVSPQAPSAALADESAAGGDTGGDEEVEISAGGDENAMPGDTIAVTRPVDAFDLHPNSLGFEFERGTSVTLRSLEVLTSHRDDEAWLLFNMNEDEISLPPPMEVTRWDNGRRWEAIGSFSELSGSEPEAPLEAGGIITARDGWMARLEADLTISTDQIAKFLQLDAARLRALVPASQPESGTAMRMAEAITMAKGERLHFEVFFDGASQMPFNDFAIMTVRHNGVTESIPFSAIADLEAARRGGSGWLTLTYTAGEDGSYRFGFAVLNDDDASLSRLYVDNVHRGSASPFQLEVLARHGDGWGGRIDIQRPLPSFLASEQQLTIAPGETIALNPLANVIDPDGYDAPFVVGVDREGTRGSLTLLGDGMVLYSLGDFYAALAQGEFGSDRFAYLVDGGNGGIGRATVTVSSRVAGVNDAPMARDDGAVVDLEVLSRSGMPFPIGVLLNDDDIDSDDDGSTLRLLSAVSTAGAEVTIARIGTFFSDGLLYDPQRLAAAQALSLGQTLLAADTITYRISDRWGATAEARVFVTWIGANDAPTAVADAVAISEDEESVGVAVLANDDDVDGDDDASTLRLVAATAERGTVEISDNGWLTLFPGSGFDGLALGELATYEARYRVADRHGAMSEGVVSVSVIGANDAPTAIADVGAAVEDGPAVAINVLANDDDIDSDDDATTLHLVAAESVKGARVSLRPGGIVLYDLAGIAAFDVLREGQVVEAFDTVTYTIRDRHGAEATATVSVTVTGTNDPIVAHDDVFIDDGFGRPLAVTEDRVDPLPVLANDVDPDQGDTKTITAINGIAVSVGGQFVLLPSGATVRVAPTGEVIFDPNGQFEWLSVGERINETFTYTVADGYGSSDDATVTLVLRGINDAPVALDDYAETDEETLIRVAALANDYDPDRLDRITLTGTDLPSELFAIGVDGAVIFDPRGRLDRLSVGQSETFALRYEISDPHGAQAAARVFVTVHGVNDAPIAGNDEFLVFANEGAIRTSGVSLLDTDYDPDERDNLVVTAVNGSAAAVNAPIWLPGGGRLTVFADGTFAYDPMGVFDPLARDELARLSFTYRIGDGHGGEDEASVTLIIRGVNDAPRPAPDFAEAIENGPLVFVDVLANDVDPDGPADTALLRLIDAVSMNGADARVSPDQRLAYQTLAAFDHLAVGEVGIDEVLYTVRDRFGAEAIGHLTVTITGTNDAPTANLDTARFRADALVRLDVVGNDDDVDSDDDAATLRLIAATTAWGEPVAIMPDRTLLLDPRTVAAFMALGEGAERTFAAGITYTIADRHGAEAVGAVAVTVIGVNDPIVANDDTFSIGEDDTVRLVVDGNDEDPDIGDVKQIVAINGVAVAVGVPITLASGSALTLLADNRIEMTPSAIYNRLGVGATAIEAFAYTIADGFGSVDSATVTVTINGVNDLPIARDDSAETYFDEAIRIDVLANDEDPDEGDVLRVRTLIDESRGANGEIFIDRDGSIVFDPAGRFNDLRPGESRSVNFRYIVEDDHGGEAVAAITIKVSGRNRPPIAGDDAFVVPADRPTLPDVERSVLATDGDADGDALAVTAVNGNAGAVGVPIDLPSGGRLTLFADGTFTFDPMGAFDPLARGEVAEVGFRYTVMDNAGNSDEANVTLFIQGVNEAPVARDDEAVVAEDGPAVRIDVLANDDDVDSDDDRTSLRLLGAVAQRGEVTATADRTLLYSAGNAFERLAEGETATDEILYTVADRHGAEATARVTVTILGLNDAPDARNDAAFVIEDGPAITIDVRANDDDIDSDDDATTLRLIEATSHVGGRVQIEADGTLTFDPLGAFDALKAGEIRIVSDALSYTVEDRHGARASATVSLTVTGVNDAPIALPDAIEVGEDDPRSAPLAVLANDRDPDGDVLRIVGINGQLVAPGEAADLPSGARVRIEAGSLILYEPARRWEYLALGERATDTFSYRVDDGAGGFADAVVTVTVLGANDAPTAVRDVATMAADGVAEITVLANDDDVDADDDATTLKVVSAVSLIGGDVVVNGDGTLVFRPGNLLPFAELAEGETRTFLNALRYTIEDRHGARSDGVVDLIVTGVNDPIIAVDDAFAVPANEATALVITANDIDPDFGDERKVLAINGMPVAVGDRLTLPSGAELILLADGRILFDPLGIYTGLSAGETATEAFSYLVSDGRGSSDSAMVTVTVVGINEAPIANDDVAVTDADSAVRLFVLANDSDPDARDVLQVRTIVPTSGRVDGVPVSDVAEIGEIRVNSDGSLTYDPAGRFDGLAVGETRAVSFQYVVEDNHGATAVATTTVTVVGVANPQPRGQELLGSFETTDPLIANSAFPGWLHLPTRAMGSVAVGGLSDFAGELAPFQPTHLGRVAQLTAAGISAGSLAELLDVPQQALPRDIDGTNVTGGTALALRLSVPDSVQTLSFDWNFLSAENGAESGINDVALFTVSDGTTLRVFTLADARSVGQGASGWRTSVFDISSLYGERNDLTLRLGFAVLNDQTPDNPSRLLLDNVRFDRVLSPDFVAVGRDDGLAHYQQQPTAIDDDIAAARTDEDTPIGFVITDLLANDFASRGAATQSRRIVAVETVSGLGLAFVVGDVVRFDPAGAFDGLAEGDLRSETLIYTMTDANGGSDRATLRLWIEGRNDAPITAPDQVITGEDAPVQVTVAHLLANDRDPDAGDVLSFSGFDAAGLAGTLTIDGNVLTYDPGGRFEFLSVGASAVETVTYTVQDRLGATATGTLTIVVEGRNDAPVAADDTFSVNADRAYYGARVGPSVLANDRDPDVGDRLSVVAVAGLAAAVGEPLHLPSGGTLTLWDDGTFDFDPRADFRFLNAGETVAVSVLYSIGDDHGGVATTTLTFLIAGVNDAPQAADDFGETVEDAPLTLAVLMNDFDADDRDRLSIAAVDQAGLIGRVTVNLDQTLTYDPAGQFDWLPAGATTEEHFFYTVRDLAGATSSASVTVRIIGQNDPIRAVDDVVVADEDTPTVLDILSNDIDPDRGDSRRIVAVNAAAVVPGERIALPSGAFLVLLANGRVEYDAAGAFEALGRGEQAIDHFTYDVADDAGTTDRATVTVTVVGDNDLPIARADTTQTDENAQVRIAVLANDDDIDARDVLRVTGVDASRTFGLVRINADGTLTYDPNGEFAGLSEGQTATDRFTYTINDGQGGEATATVTVTIHGVGAPLLNPQQLILPFETSDQDMANALFPGWRQVPMANSGATSIAQVGPLDGPLALFAPTHLDKAALISLAGGRVADINDLFNVPSNTFTATEGAAIATTLSLGFFDAGGDGRITLSFDWNFIGGETGNPAPLDDRALFSISNGTGVDPPTLWYTATFADIATNGSGPSGWRTSIFDISAAFDIPPEGLFVTIGFGIIGSSELLHPSQLLLDNVRLNRVLSPDYDLIGGSADDRFTTWRQNPTAIDDGLVAAVSEDGSVDIDVALLLANDFATRGAVDQSRRVVAVESLSGLGVLTLANDTFRFDTGGGYDDLAEGDQRLETVIYTLTDANGGRDTGLAQIVIQGVNDAPIAAAVTATTSEDAAFSIDIAALLSLARDVDAGDRLNFAGVEGSGLIGRVSTDAFAVFYDPAGLFDFLAVGETFAETLAYFVEDRSGARGRGTITVTITGVNDAPVVGDDAFDVSEDGLTSLDVLANDRDIDGDALNITRINGFAVPPSGVYPLPSGATLLVDPLRGLTFDAAGQYEWLGEGEVRIESFTYTVDDRHGGVSVASVTLTVRGANDAPTAGNDSAVTDEDAMVRIAVLANDTDPDVNDRLSLLSVDTTGTLGQVRMSPDGTVIYDPAHRFNDLFEGQFVTDTFRYTATDRFGATSTASVTVSIYGKGTPQSHPQQLISSFEIPWQQAGPGWQAEPFVAGGVSPIRLTSAFGETFGPGFPVRDDLIPVFTQYTPTHRELAVQLAAFGSSGYGVGDAPSAIETFLAIPGGSLPNDTGAFSGERGDGTEANAGAAIRTTLAVTEADKGDDGLLTLSFDWNFVSAETVGDSEPGNNDFAVVSVSDGMAWQLFTLADARSTGFGASGWRTSLLDLSSVFTLPAFGALNLIVGFAVLNDQTPDTPSYLIIDNVRFNREIGTDYTLIGSAGADTFHTYRQNPTAFDDAPGGAVTSEDAVITIALGEVLANDRASWGSAVLNVVAVARLIDGVTGEEQGGHVALVDTDGEGLFDAVRYDPREAWQHLKEGEEAIDRFRYTVTDANGGRDDALVSVRVVGVNDAPIAADDTFHGEEDTPISGNVLADNGAGADWDVDGDPLFVDPVPLNAPRHGRLTLHGDGTFSFVPDENFFGTDEFTYRVADRAVGGFGDSATVRLIIAPVNDAPRAFDDVAQTNEDSPITINMLANDWDVDAGDILRPVAIAGVGVGIGQTVRLPSGAAVTLNADGTIRYDPLEAFAALRPGQQATDTFTYTVGDGNGGTASARVTVTVDGRNDAPVAVTDTFATTATLPLIIAVAQVLANDRDADAGDTLSFVGVDGTGAIGLVTFDGAAIRYDPAGRFVPLGQGETAVDVFYYTVRDEAGAAATGEIRVTVAGVNDPPVAVADVASTYENRAVVIDVLANDYDPDQNDRLSIVDFDTTGTRGRVSLNADGTVTYDPDRQFDSLRPGETATDSFRYVITDGFGARTTGDVSVTVIGKSSEETIVNSFEQPIPVEDISFGSSGAVKIKTSHVETDGNLGVYQPTDANHLAWLEAYGTSIPDLNTFLRVDLRAQFRDIDGSLPASGAALRIRVDLEAGDELSFDWMFDARDRVSGSPADNDFALVSITNADGGTHFFKLSDVRATGDNGATGWRSTVYTAEQGGSVTVAFGVINDRASDFPSTSNPASENSMLLLDNVRLNRDFSEGYQVVDTSADGRFETVVPHHG